MTSGLLQPKGHWVVSGCAGFIASHILERLLNLGYKVVGIDNFSGGSPGNLEAVRKLVGEEKWKKFHFIEGDIRSPEICDSAMVGASVVLHNAALGSVPRSMKEPALFHSVNIDGTHTLLESARCNGVKRFVFASSSSVYGDNPALPKVEGNIGEPLSPYAATKRVNEIEASVYARSYGMETIGLRYFNVFGPRQNPKGAYAAVIPKWISSIIAGENIEMFGDGTNSRDFCYVSNVVDANLAASSTSDVRAFGKSFNIACGDRTNLNELAQKLVEGMRSENKTTKSQIVRHPPRAGDIAHSHADVSFARLILGYNPSVKVDEGLMRTLRSYI